MDSEKIDEPYAEILYTLVHIKSFIVDRKFELNNILDYIKIVFQVDDECHNNILNEVNCRDPPNLQIAVKCKEIKKLRPTSATGTGNYMVKIFENPSSDHIGCTKIQFDSCNPKWIESFTFPLETFKTNSITFKVYNCTALLTDSDMYSFSPEKDSKQVENIRQPRMVRRSISLINKLTQCGHKNKQLVGKASVPLQAILTEGGCMWLDLEKRDKSKNRGAIHVQLNYCAPITRERSIKEFQCLVHHLLLHNIQMLGLVESWDGQFSEQGEAVIAEYLSRSIISELDIAISKWVVYSKLLAQHPISYILFDNLMSFFVNFSDNIILDDIGIIYIRDGASCLLPSLFEYLQNQIINKNDDELKILLNIISKLLQLFDRKTDRNEICNLNLIEKLKQAVVAASHSWFEKTVDDLQLKKKTDSEYVASVRNLIAFINDRLSSAIKLKEIFSVKDNFRCVETLFLVYDEKLEEILKELKTNENENLQPLNFSIDYSFLIDSDRAVTELKEEEKTQSLFMLFLSIKELEAFGTKIVGEELKLKKFQHLFTGKITIWLQLAMHKAAISIMKAITIDDFIPHNENAKYTSSAIDTVTILFQIKDIWEKQLEWRNEKESITIISKILYEICQLCVFYAKKIQESIETPQLNHKHNKTNLKIIEKWSLVINNTEFIRKKIEDLINDLYNNNIIDSMAHLNNPCETDQINELLQSIWECLRNIKNVTILEEINKLTNLLTSNIKKSLVDAVKSRKFKSDCIENRNLLNSLNESMDVLRSDFDSKIFERFMEIVLVELKQVFQKVIPLTEHKPNPELYSELKLFFYDIVYIITQIEPSDEAFKMNLNCLEDIHNLIKLHTLETATLIRQYHTIRCMSQNDEPKEENATLSVKCYFDENTLIVELLNARRLNNVVLDSDNKCNLIVKIYILPLERYNLKFVTKMNKPTAGTVLIDEKFEINFHANHALDDETFVLFTVWNRLNILKTEKFLGECYLPVIDVPKSFVDRQTHLNIAYDNNGVENILTLLERRRSDGKAKKFCNKILKRNISL